MSGRRIFVGDIQGCRAELELLLEAVDFEPGRDALHPVGDLVNRGPDNVGVLRRLMELDAGGVLGNHDVHALRVRAGTRKPGRRDTLKDLARAADRDVLLDWLGARPLIRSWPDVTLVHAGLSPRWNDPAGVLDGLDPLLPHPDTDFALSARHCDPIGRRPERDWPAPDEPFRPWYELVEPPAGHTFVFGHWARQGLVVRPGVRGLDTGCVWGGRLTAWIAEEDRLVHVDATEPHASHG